jgi:hypothetical protein
MEWVAKNRKVGQQRITLIVETGNETIKSKSQPPDGLVAIVGNPICLNALKMLAQQNFIEIFLQ